MNHEQHIDDQEHRSNIFGRVAAAAALLVGAYVAGGQAVEFFDDLRNPSYEGVGENITNLVD